MRYLITGGAGLTGSHLTEKLLADKSNSVRVFDNFSSGNLANLETVKSNPRLTITEGSILDVKELAKVSRNGDFIFHLAASLGVKNVVENPIEAGFVFPNFIQQALKNETLTIYGTGKQIRSFTHVKDSVEAIVKLSQTPQAYGQVFNVGSINSTTIEGPAQKIIELTNSASKIKKIPYEKVFGKNFEDIPKRMPSLEKLRSVIKFTPQYNLDQIILETANWIKGQKIGGEPLRRGSKLLCQKRLKNAN